MKIEELALPVTPPMTAKDRICAQASMLDGLIREHTSKAGANWSRDSIVGPAVRRSQRVLRELQDIIRFSERYAWPEARFAYLADMAELFVDSPSEFFVFARRGS